MMRADFTRSKITKAIIYAENEKTEAICSELTGGTLPMTGWVHLPVTIGDDEIARIKYEATRLRSISDSIVLIGIGGSYLGAKACFEMVKGEFANLHNEVKFYFAGWNMSGTYHKQLLDEVSGGDVSIIVVSKSGSTTETTAAYLLFKKLLTEKYEKDYSKHICVVSESGSILHKEAIEEGYTFFEMDPNVGGRYSVLSAAGLLPIAAMDIDISSIMRGAKNAYKELMEADIRENFCCQYAAVRNKLKQLRGKTNEIFMINEPRLEFFGQWLIQLFGESEGKHKQGIMPTELVLTRDLHSMGQFLQDGAEIFFETFITVDRPAHNATFDEKSPTYNEYNNIIATALLSSHRATPIIQFKIQDLSEITFGYMVYYFEKACAISASMFGVNPFDQPGVEIYKAKVRDLTKDYALKNCNVRSAKTEDLDRIVEIIEESKAFLKTSNVPQWNDGYPQAGLIGSDIQNHAGYVITGPDGGVLAYFVLTKGHEADYEKIYDGAWVNDSDNYITLHRTAVGEGLRGRGIGRLMFEFAIEYAKSVGADSVRVDTHEDNERMRRLIGHFDFTYCGVIYIDEVLPRVAYELPVGLKRKVSSDFSVLV